MGDTTVDEGVLGQLAFDVSGPLIQDRLDVQYSAAAPDSEGGLVEWKSGFDVGLNEGFLYAEHWTYLIGFA